MSRDYNVGYKKPPEHSRFKKGQSGNPKGRPKGKQSLKSTVDAALNRKRLVSMGGEEKPMSSQQLVIERCLQEAIKGSSRHLSLLIQILKMIGPLETPAPEQTGGVLVVPATMNPDDWEKAVAEYTQRVQRRIKEES